LVVFVVCVVCVSVIKDYIAHYPCIEPGSTFHLDPTARDQITSSKKVPGLYKINKHILVRKNLD
jgi:hypothetical protein